jgi:hypothetical protein
MISPAMLRIPRAQQAGFVYPVINQGNDRATIFHKAQDYQAFLSILALAKARHPVKMFAFSLMPPSHELRPAELKANVRDGTLLTS